jgi:D-tyrosyl-tRNA(Tyr) deacylase
MKAVVQRVKRASVSVGGATTAAIGPGLLVLLGVAAYDGDDDAALIARKLSGLRIFSDSQGLMNLSIIDVKGELLLVSQFTLLANSRKGNRPSFADAARPEVAERYYLDIARDLSSGGIKVETGVFGEMMDIELVNNGPVTIILDTRERASGFSPKE